MKVLLPMLFLVVAAQQATPFPQSKGPFETFDTKIIGGTQVMNETKHPYYVLIAGSDTIRYSYCSGSLIAANMVLTSAFCINSWTQFVITAGDIDSDVTTGNEQERTARVSDIIYHPNFKPILGTNSVAIIKLRDPFVLNDYVNVIQIEKEDLTPDLHAGEEASIVGFGFTSDVSGISSVLNEADEIGIITNEYCNTFFTSSITNEKMCTDTTNGKGICEYEYGAPLIQENNGQKEQIGIAYAFFTGGCLEGYPNWFTRVSFFSGWIESEMQKLQGH